MTKIIFVIAGLGHGTRWGVLASTTFFNIPQGEGLFYKFGANGQLHKIGKTTPFPRIVETIKTQLALTPQRHSLVYCGWELLECLPELWERFPDATYLIPTVNFLEDNWQDWTTPPYGQMFIKEAEFPVVTKLMLDTQLSNIKEFLKDKPHKILREDPVLRNKIDFKNFQGICVCGSKEEYES